MTFKLIHFLFFFDTHMVIMKNYSLLCFSELKAIILGPADLYVKSGSEITLVCKLQQGPHDLGTVFWYKGKLGKIQLVMNYH